MSPCSGSSTLDGVQGGYTSRWWMGSCCRAEAADDQPEIGHTHPNTHSQMFLQHLSASERCVNLKDEPQPVFSCTSELI